MRMKKMRKISSRKEVKVWIAVMAFFALLLVWGNAGKVYASDEVTYVGSVGVSFADEDQQLEMGSGDKLTLKDIFYCGSETYEGMTIETKYKKYLAIDSKKGIIKAKNVKEKDYKNMPKEAVVKIKFGGGRVKDLKISLLAKAPKTNLVRIKKGVYVSDGKEYFLYTFDWSKVPYADKIEVEILEGTGMLSKYDVIRKRVNSFLEKRITTSGGSTSIAINKDYFESKNAKLQFDIMLKYGKGKKEIESVSRVITK